MAYLVLSNGMTFEGQRIGAPVDRMGELVFTTGMVGYLETLTDPSYYGQLVVQTFPLIGNYGIIEEDFEGESALFGYIVRELCDMPSNFRCQYDVNTYLVRHGIPGLCGVDTREITRITREEIRQLLEACREKGITSVAIVGANPCPMDDYDYVIHVPSTVTPRVQECQTLIGHILCFLVENRLFGRD